MPYEKKPKSIHPRTNWLGLTKWRKLYDEMVFSCCDCGLAHTYFFRNIKGTIMWRCKRNKQITKLNRKTYAKK